MNDKEPDEDLGCVSCRKLEEILTDAMAKPVGPKEIVTTIEGIIRNNEWLQEENKVVANQRDLLKTAHKALSELL